MSELPILHIQRLDHGRGLELPRYQTPGSAGMDLRAAVEEPLELAPGARALVPTGFIMAIPDGHEGQVRSRSGMALRRGLVVLNSPGTVDSDYRGEVGVILANLGQHPVIIERGERVAQLVISPVVQVRPLEFMAVEDDGERGDGGFGSTGTD